MNLDIQHFKTLLEAEKAKIEEELGAIATKDENGVWQTVQKETEDTADREDVAGAIESYENNENTVSILGAELNEVNRALDKIAAGTYGTCEVSGEEIEADRLEANPSARTCKQHMNS